MNITDVNLTWWILPRHHRLQVDTKEIYLYITDLMIHIIYLDIHGCKITSKILPRYHRHQVDPDFTRIQTVLSWHKILPRYHRYQVDPRLYQNTNSFKLTQDFTWRQKVSSWHQEFCLNTIRLIWMYNCILPWHQKCQDDIIYFTWTA
jgi:hypothetical protein